ncbi:hypothetical protein [Methylotenera sp. 1P/1]|uniref:hypothetical protein n=1 Tax=Methylotenera sp. 1P/1 TaxID=1131551 RepID=UPI0003816101|nr:hypothetical protein [Methylotenera sp. 1P/1]
MLTYLRARTAFFCELFKEGVAWKIGTFLWTILSLLILARDEFALPADDEAYKLIKIFHLISFQNWLTITVILFLIWFFESSFHIYIRLSKRIKELEKIDKDDLCHLLKGFYIENTFITKGEIIPCAIYRGKFNIDQLIDKFVEIEVLAPKFSLANIKIELFNGHNSEGAEYKFYLLDSRNKEIPVNDIYDYMGQEVYLGVTPKFSIKLKHNELFEIHENATVQISLNSWTK